MFVTVVVPTWKVLPLGGMLITLAGPQPLVAMTVNVTLLRLHWPGSVATTMLVGQTSTGGCVFRTITRCEHVAVLPLASVASQTTTLVPTGKTFCEGALLVTVTTVQLSLVSGVPSTTLVAEHNPMLAGTFTSLGHVM